MSEREVDEEMRREMNTLVAAYVLDALPVDERAAFEAYLDGAPDTAEEVTGLFATSAVLGSTSAAAVPPGLRERVLATAAQTRQLPPLTRTTDAGQASSESDMLIRRVSVPPAASVEAVEASGRHTAPARPDGSTGAAIAAGAVAATDRSAAAGSEAAGSEGVGSGADVVTIEAAALRRRRTRSRLLTSLALAAAVVLAVVVGVQQGRLSSARDSAAASRTQLAAFQSVAGATDAQVASAQVAGGGNATVLASQSAGRGVVVLDGVEQLPDAKTYELWLINPQGTPRPVRTFDTANSAATVDFAGLNPGDTVGVSVEAAGGSTTGAPTTKPIFTVQVA